MTVCKSFMFISMDPMKVNPQNLFLLLFLAHIYFHFYRLFYGIIKVIAFVGVCYSLFFFLCV